jgi:hypothetical protein
MRKLLVAVFLVAMAAAPAMAQTERPVGFNIGAGWLFPVSGLKDAFSTGGNFRIGATYHVNPKVGVLAEYGYDWMPGPERTFAISSLPIGGTVSSGILESNHHIHSGTFDMVFTAAPSASAVGGYVLGGAGVYNRTVQITTPSVGYTTICDPYWYVCYPTLVSVDRIVGDRGSTDFGINVGGGVTFGHNAKFYVEMRYHYVWGPKVEPQAGTLPSSTASSQSFSSNAQYLPLTFGVRW